MATVTATVTVNFKANYAGDHRICWRIQGTTAYDCSTIVNCVGGGNVCSATFNVPVNTTSCDGDVVIEGYVQAICEDISSTNGRLPFSVIYTPSPTCLRQLITCARTPIISIPIASGGTGYAITDTVVINRDPSDTSTQDAIISIASVDINGAITGFTITNGGLYSVPPTITIVSGTGTGFLSDIVTLGNCPIISTLGNDCAGNAVNNISIPNIGDSFATCIEGPIGIIPHEFDIVQAGCCIAADSTSTVCTEYTIDNQSGADITIRATLCNGIDSTITVPTGTISTLCVIDGGIIDPNITGVTITNTGIVCL